MSRLLEGVPEVRSGALRSLWFSSQTHYQEGLVEREGGAMWMVDAGLNRASAPALLELPVLRW